jgi:hypothetical protein
MPTDESEFLVQYRALVESRVREQIERHQKVNLNGDPRRVVEIQMKQERESIELLIAADDTTTSQVELLQELIEWLPQLQRRLVGR